MPRYVVRRLLAAIPTLLGVTVILFVALRLLPGDPVSVLIGVSQGSDEVADALREQFGLDDPPFIQYLHFLGSIFTGDLGTSYVTRQTVGSMIASQIAPTLILASAAALVSAVVGISLGALAAIQRDRWPDTLIRVLSLVFTAMPNFWLGLVFIVIFAFGLRLLPATGTDGLKFLILPAITLGLSASGVIARVVRNSLIETMDDSFVLALYAKGLRPRVVMVKHVLRNAVIPAVTVLGLQLGALIAGAVIVETVFARRGLGQVLVQAVANNDFPVIQGVVLVIAVIYIVINIVVDLSYAYIDPRVRSAVVGARR
ncbi:ABC transporter permease [Ornithinimicrobium pratense]|uniref:ABC transporter permease n=1 Tax=Ornithinimicrobium pratense TaxID=2593973 RepID=A0A5J6V646_9MICO|nr:ABC transporter permease [Ornithinimicrobium pratense]QFG69480.1 ABC transporter permease [Ornithinimicrobium pratense]